MLVKYNTDDLGILPAKLHEYHQRDDKRIVSDLELGRSYVILGITSVKNELMYYIPAERGGAYWYSARLFEVADDRVPDDWRLVVKEGDDDEQNFILSFPEWANDDTFYWRWSEGDLANGPEARIMERYRQKYERFHAGLRGRTS